MRKTAVILSLAILLLVSPEASARFAFMRASEEPQRDSAALAAFRDSIDRMWWSKIDTVTRPYVDSIFQAHFDSIARFLPDSADIKKVMKRNRKEERDSIRIHKPRVLETFAVPDSMYYERLLMWTADTKFNELHFQKQDTTFNYHFYDYPMFKKDVNATYLGTIGSATLYHNWFKREEYKDAPMFTPYAGDSNTPDNLPQYNTKSAYTELAYWGTLFAMKQKEEAELNLLTTQNITPAFNFTLGYRRLGSKGFLQDENTDHRNAFVYGNYMGKKYMANAGFIHQKIKRSENGGVQNTFWIRDTLIDTKTIDVNLKTADNLLKRNTFFLNHSLAIPMNFFRKDKDSLSLGDGTMAFVGHYIEYSVYKKNYNDVIAPGDIGRSFYNYKFYLDETTSDSRFKVNTLTNKAFIKLQPFAPDAVVSKINGGIGYQFIKTSNTNVYETVEKGVKNTYHNVFVYAGVSGRFKKYFEWDADGEYYFSGFKKMDFNVNGKIRVSFYPIEEGIHLIGKFSTSLDTPHPFEQFVITNHHYWDNDFKKVSTTKAEAILSIPKWKLEASFNYGLIGNMLYYDNLSIIRQSPKTVQVMTATLQKNFKVWALHFDHKALFQLTTDPDILPLPKLSLHLRYYVQFNVVKNVMAMQIGLDGLFHNKYYAPAYDPDLGQFHTQTKEKIGGVPYFDAFVNMQWKRACVFVKYTNCFMGWPSSDYFSAYQYIRPGHGLKFGIFWPFYLH